MNNCYLVTGTAGFIGCEVALKLLEAGKHVVGVDNVNDYYDVSLKRARLARLSPFENYRHQEFCLSDSEKTSALFSDFSFSFFNSWLYLTEKYRLTNISLGSRIR